MLCKTAAKHGVAELLPWSMKLPSVKLARREERGLRVKGTGEGEKVKGHKWERTMKGKVKGRKEAMVGMPVMVREWKEVSRALGLGREVMEVLTMSAERAWTWMEEVAEMKRVLMVVFGCGWRARELCSREQRE